jgi:hypothetical protein
MLQAFFCRLSNGTFWGVVALEATGCLFAVKIKKQIA